MESGEAGGGRGEGGQGRGALGSEIFPSPTQKKKRLAGLRIEGLGALAGLLDSASDFFVEER